MSFRNSKNSFSNMKNEARTQVVFSVTPEELDAIKRAANECGLNVSQYCRTLIFKRTIRKPKPISFSTISPAMGALPDPTDPMDETNLFQR